MKRHFPLRVVLFLLMSALLHAQDKPTPPPRPFSPDASAPKASLPALQLPEYVITGSDLMKFTSDRKRGIGLTDEDGFSERAGRGEREQRFQDTSPNRSALSLETLPGSSEVLYARAGYGTFYTPSVEAWYGQRFAKGDVYAHALFERSDGWVPGSDYSVFGIDAAGGTYLPRDVPPLFASSRVQSELHMYWRRYGLYANKTGREHPAPEFRRKRFDLGYAADLISRRNPVIDHHLRVFFDYVRLSETLSAFDSLQLDEYDHTEAVFGIDAGAEQRFLGVPLRGGFFAAFYNNTETVEGSGSPLYMRMSVDGGRRLADDWTLDAGLAFYVFHGNMQATQGRLYPRATVRYSLMPNITLFGSYDPEVHRLGLQSLTDQNPYLMMSAELQHRQTPWRFKAGVEFDRRSKTSGALWLEYSASNAFPRYELLDDPVRQQWLLRYDGWVTMVGLHGEGRHQINERMDISGSVLLRSSRSETLDGRVPYLPDVELRAIYGYQVLESLHVAASLHFFGPRTGDAGTLPAAALLGAEAEYRFLKNAGAFLRFENIADQDYQLWQGYQERPFFMQAGLTLHM